MRPYYRTEAQPDWCLMREWGSIGTTGRELLSPSLARQRRTPREHKIELPRELNLTLA